MKMKQAVEITRLAKERGLHVNQRRCLSDIFRLSWACLKLLWLALPVIAFVCFRGRRLMVNALEPHELRYCEAEGINPADYYLKIKHRRGVK